MPLRYLSSVPSVNYVVSWHGYIASLVRCPGYMRKFGTTSHEDGRLARATGRLARVIRAFSDQLFQADDVRARQYGWQITTRRAGLTRTYRDPRFDRLQGCPACRGTGTSPDDRACDRCAGTGRITVSAEFRPEARRAG